MRWPNVRNYPSVVKDQQCTECQFDQLGPSSPKLKGTKGADFSLLLTFASQFWHQNYALTQRA
jgi:hypothetical protein